MEAPPSLLAKVRRRVQEIITGTSPERDLEILGMLAKEPMTLGDLRMTFRGASMVVALARLEDRGYVVPIWQPGSKHPNYYTLTPEGLRRLTDILSGKKS